MAAETSRSRFAPTNVRLKLTAIFLALLVFVSVYLDNEQEATIRVPLVIENRHVDRMVVGDVPREVVARVVAPGRLLAGWWLTRNVGNLHAVVEVPPTGTSIDRWIAPEDVVVPLGVELRVLDIIEPTNIRLHLDQVSERLVPVVAVRTGSPPQGYILSGPLTVRPESVLVRGPHETLANLGEVSTAPLDLTGRSRPIHEMIPLVHADPLSFSPPEVQVSADIERTDQLSVDAVPVRVLNGRQYRVTVEPETGSVVLMGPRSQLENIEKRKRNGEPTGLSIAVDVAGMGPGQHEIGPNVSLTDDLRLVAVSPATIRVTISDASAESP